MSQLVASEESQEAAGSDEESRPRINLLEASRPRSVYVRVAGRSASQDRLREGILAGRPALRARAAGSRQRPGPTPACDEASLTALIADYLDLAAQAYRAGAINLGWGFLHRAGETEVLLMERPELDAAAVALAAECAGG